MWSSTTAAGVWRKQKAGRSSQIWLQQPQVYKKGHKTENNQRWKTTCDIWKAVFKNDLKYLESIFGKFYSWVLIWKDKHLWRSQQRSDVEMAKEKEASVTEEVMEEVWNKLAKTLTQQLWTEQFWKSWTGPAVPTELLSEILGRWGNIPVSMTGSGPGTRSLQDFSFVSTNHKILLFLC